MKLKLRNQLFFILLISLLMGSASLSATGLPGSTDGTVTFTVLTVSNGATYSPKNVLAIWVKDSNGDFVISRKVMANVRKQHLVKWNASSGGNVVNATTGATLPNHQTHTVAWDCRDVNGNLVPDGTYEIWVEYTSRNSANGGDPGPSTKVVFTKGVDVVSLNPADETYFKNMSLTYTPLNVGLADKTKPGLIAGAYPNPFTDHLNLTVELPATGYVNISVYDANGRRVNELVNSTLTQGRNEVKWNGSNAQGKDSGPGVYFLRFVYNGSVSQIKTIRLN